MLFTAGILAGTTYLKLYYLIPIIFISSILGSIIGYFIGTHIERLRTFPFFRKILKEEHINKAHIFFEKHGKFAILFSRFIPVVRTFTPIVAGIARMNYKSFIKYNILSSLVWSSTVTLLGFFLGRIFPNIKDYLSLAIIIIILISILPMIIPNIRRKKS